MSGIEFRNEKTRLELEELMKPEPPKPTVYMRVVYGTFFRHTVFPDGRHTVEVIG